MKKLFFVVLPAALILFSPQAARAWGYYGQFYFGGQQLPAYRSATFAAQTLRSGFGNTVSWSAAPKFYAVMFATSAFPADFAITTGSTLNSFINYGSYSAYSTRLSGYGTMSLRPGVGSYGFGARNQQPVTNRFNVDYFKSYDYTVQSVQDYIAGIHPKKNSGKYSATAWSRYATVVSGLCSFPLIESGKTQDRKYLHSLTIPQETTAGTYSRYVWYNGATLSASVNSGVYIIPVSHYSSFISGGSFSYYETANGCKEIRLPSGTYYVVAVNALNSTAIDAGSVVSIVYQYR